MADTVEEQAGPAAVRRYEILDPPRDGSFDRIALAAAKAFRVPIATVTVVDEDRIGLTGRTGLEAEALSRVPGLCASAILTDELTMFTPARLDPEALNNPLVRDELGLRFYAAAPIVTRDGHRLGTVKVMDRAPRSVSPNEAELLRSLAAIVADQLDLRLAARRTVRLERQMVDKVLRERRRAEVEAEDLSRGLHPPRLPRIPGLQVAGYYRPEGGARLAGDFYDVFPTTDGRWGLIIGDVVGHGVQAAAVAAMARFSLRTALMSGESAEQALAVFNRAMLFDQPDGGVRFCTAVCAVLERSGHDIVVRLANGGHPRPIVVRSDGAVEAVSVAGTLVGCFEDPDLSSYETALHPGDAAVFYTDGIIDPRHAANSGGEEDVRRVLSTAAGLSAEQLVRRLVDGLASPEGEVRDDIALLALALL